MKKGGKIMYKKVLSVFLILVCAFNPCFLYGSEEETVQEEAALTDEAEAAPEEVLDEVTADYKHNTYALYNIEAEIRKNSCYTEYPVYLDGEATGQTLRVCTADSSRVETLISFKDLIEIFGGKYRLLFINDESIYRGSYYDYKYAEIDLDGYTYEIAGSNNLAELNPVYDEFRIRIGYKSEEDYDNYRLELSAQNLTGYYLNGEIYLLSSAAYFLSQKEGKMFNFDNDCFNIQTHDSIAEDKSLKEILPTGWHTWYKDNRGTWVTKNHDVDFYYDSTREFLFSYAETKEYVNSDITIGHSVSERDIEEYAKLIICGTYHLQEINYNLYVDYNEDLGVYIVYNKDYSNLPSGEDYTSEGKDPAMRLIAIRAYDGKMVYCY